MLSWGVYIKTIRDLSNSTWEKNISAHGFLRRPFVVLNDGGSLATTIDVLILIQIWCINALNGDV